MSKREKKQRKRLAVEVYRLKLLVDRLENEKRELERLW